MLGLFKGVDEENPVGKMLIVTWYADFTEWEKSREVGEVDRGFWAKPAAMELNQFGIAARIGC